MSVPDGWTGFSADNFQEMFRKLRDKFPQSLQGVLAQRRIEVAFLNPEQEAEFTPNISVAVLQGDAPDFDEQQQKRNRIRLGDEMCGELP